MEYKSLLDSIIKISIQAGEKILDIYNDKETFKNISYKSDNSPLTLADKASNAPTTLTKDLLSIFSRSISDFSIVTFKSCFLKSYKKYTIIRNVAELRYELV